MSRRARAVAGALLLLALAFAADAAGPGEAAAGHGRDVSRLLLAITVILLLARLGAHAFESLRMPGVLGELIGGIAIGNLGLVGIEWFEFLREEPALETLAEIGIVLLLFLIGLESNMRDMVRVGTSSLLAATLGVVAPFALGYAVSGVFLRDAASLVHVFVGATLCATSVGITARVLQDIGRLDAVESRIILGAAVIDDVLGLIILGVVTGAISAAELGTSLDAGSLLGILGRALFFFVAAGAIGVYVSPRTFALASRLRGAGVLLATSLVFCFGLACLAAAVGLAPIVGGFAAGLALDEVHYRDFTNRGEHTIEELVGPLASFLTPFFFVLMGLRVDLAVIARLDTLGFALALTLAAVLGKQACALGVLHRGVNRAAVGLGMIPRGEVGLIFVGIGASLYVAGRRVIDPATYSALIFMVIFTTLMTPIFLTRALGHTATPSPAETSDPARR